MGVLNTSYTLSRCTGVCAATGRALAIGESCVAVLVERDDAAALERVDYSTDAWSSGARPTPPARAFAHWRATHQAGEPSGKLKPLLSDDELLDLFTELGDATEPRRQAFRYVLGLMLVRRRVLISCGSTRSSARAGGSGSFLVRPKGTPPETEPIEVRDPGLDDALVAEAIEQLSRVVPTEGTKP
jgi:hypothetical protein